MALALNTSHPLYGNLLALICVDDDNTVKDLRGNQTCTKDAACTIQSSTGYGRAFRTTFSSGNARGVSLSPGVALGVSAPRSVFIVTNTINSLNGSRYMAINVMATGDGWSPGVSGSYIPRLVAAGGGTIAGTSAVNSGGHSWGGAADRNGNATKVFADGVTVATGNANQSGYGSSTLQTYIGGEYTGSYGGIAADYVWVAFFDKYLTDAEISALHASLGADNTFALIASANAASTISATLANITGSVTSVSAPKTAIAATLANVAGSLASSSGSLFTTITATLGNVVGAITSTGSTTNGTFTSEVLKDYAGNVLANTALNFVRFYNDTTGALVLNKTGVTTNGSGIVTFSDAALVAGTTYRVDWETAAGSRRMPRKAAA